MKKARPVESVETVPSDTVSGSFPFGSLAIRGRESLYILVASGSIAVLVWVLVTWVAQNNHKLIEQTDELSRQHQEIGNDVRDSTRVISQGMAAQHAEISAAVQGLTNAMDEANYLATLPPQKRQKLNLEMPQSLKNKLIQRSYP